MICSIASMGCERTCKIYDLYSVVNRPVCPVSRPVFGTRAAAVKQLDFEFGKLVTPCENSVDEICVRRVVLGIVVCYNVVLSHRYRTW